MCTLKPGALARVAEAIAADRTDARRNISNPRALRATLSTSEHTARILALEVPREQQAAFLAACGIEATA